MNDDPLSGDEFLTETARTMLLCQDTPALFSCSDTRCVHNILTWHDQLPSFTWDTPRRWPECPEGHRAKFLEIVTPIACTA